MIKTVWTGITKDKMIKAKKLYKDELDSEEYYKHFQKAECCICGSENDLKYYYIDENIKNTLISNIEPICLNCLDEFLGKVYNQPFTTISKFFDIAACHHLPNYDGACQNIHGHTWKCGVYIKRRINKQTGMVLDFSNLKHSVNTYIINVLDHNDINNVIENPTAENMLIWIWEKLMFEANLKGISKIELWESPTSCAVLTSEDMLSIFK